MDTQKHRGQENLSIKKPSLLLFVNLNQNLNKKVVFIVVP